MPLLYGEGEEKAFQRLQEEIIKKTNDKTILLWKAPVEVVGERPWWGLLAPSPSFFSDPEALPEQPTFEEGVTPTTMVNSRGVRLDLALAPLREDDSHMIFFAIIAAEGGNDCAIMLQKMTYVGAVYNRVMPEAIGRWKMNTIIGIDNPRLESLTKSAVIRTTHPKLQEVYVMHKSSISESQGFFLAQPRSPHCSLDVMTRGPWVPDISHDEGQMKTYFLEFEQAQAGDRDDVPAVHGTLQKSTILGELVIGVSDQRGIFLGQALILVGRDSLQDSPIGTPASFSRYWCGFRDKDSKETHIPLNRVAPDEGSWLKVGFYRTVAQNPQPLYQPFLKAQLWTKLRYGRPVYEIELTTGLE